MTEENKDVEPVSEVLSESAALSTFFGVKAGMTRIFDEKGSHVPVTVIKLVPNHITQIKTLLKDGHEAYQVARYEKRETLLTKANKGHLEKAGVENNYVQFSEVQEKDDLDLNFLGREVSIEKFVENSYVDVTGISKGKGFQGSMKRHNFSGGPASHGSKFHRRGGSIGNRATPGKVWKNKKMPGQMGNKKQTVQNIEIIEVNIGKGYLLLKGSVPGSKNSFLRISKALKK